MTIDETLALPVHPSEEARRYETSKPTGPGGWLHLYHGRDNHDQEMSDWGEDGPYFGPFDWMSCTYMSEVRFGNEGDDAHLWISPGVINDYPSGKLYRHDLCIHDDLICYDGMFYGDWSFDFYK